MQQTKFYVGETSKIVVVRACVASTGLPKTDLAFGTASLTAKFTKAGSTPVTITLVTATQGTWTSSGFIARNAPAGEYEVHLPDAVQSTDVPNVTVVVYDGAGSPTYFVTAVCMERDTDTSECVTEDQRALAGTATQAVIRLKRPDGRPATGILFSDLTCYKSVDGAAAAAVTLATITTLGTYASNGLKLISDANMPGEYAWHPETLASAGKRVRYMFTGTKIRPHVWSCDLISGADGRQAPLVVADIGKDSADRTIDAIASMAENVDGTIMTYYRPSTGLPISLPITRAARTYPVTSLR